VELRAAPLEVDRLMYNRSAKERRSGVIFLVLTAATNVVPEPMKGSSTRSSR